MPPHTPTTASVNTDLTPRMQDVSVDSPDTEDVSMHDDETPPSTTASSKSLAARGGGYFGRSAFTRRHEHNRDRDETGSSTTNLSNRAQAGSVAPSPPYSPMEETPADGDGDAEGEGQGEERFFRDGHMDNDTFAPPPEIHLQPRKHPLGREGAHMRDIPGADGTGQVQTVPLSAAALAELDREVEAELDGDAGSGERVREFMHEEDDYSSDENLDPDESKIKRVGRKVKGGMKVVEGKIARDEETVDEGKEILAQ
ncbi:hypothetical protein HMN09_00915200 [Mycena chlorophos]|uniref:Uncharacterized protein n=1 Tax=Mycena chlorophos TaxID=658473 RepID=A0A8H6SJ52_MYCCL|nr:hypothetical protein HMN09_00915200 [Mycena chlorophos]